MSDPRQSVKVIIVSNPLSVSRGPMKLIAMESPCASGMGSGWSGPVGFAVLDLFCWQLAHDGMYAASKLQRMPGQ